MTTIKYFKSSGISYKFLTRFEVLDGGNGTNALTAVNVLETWEMYGCYLAGANYGDANYATNDPMTISLNIRYDNANQTPNGVGVGTLIGRTVGAITG